MVVAFDGGRGSRRDRDFVVDGGHNGCTVIVLLLLYFVPKCVLENVYLYCYKQTTYNEKL